MSIPANRANLPVNPETATRTKHRILIVDDNVAIHEDFGKILCAEASEAEFDAEEAAFFGHAADVSTSRQTFELSFASQGVDALELVKAARAEGRRYSVLFTDVRMPPGWDGLETALKLWEEDPDLQVVICTAYSDKSWEEMMDKLGSRERVLILKKPFDAIEVLQLAHALTEKWSLLQSSRRNTEELERKVQARTGELQEANARLEGEIATRQHTEKQVREQAAFLDKAQDAIFVHDLEGRVLYWNRSAERLYGWPAADMLGASSLRRLYPDLPSMTQARASTMATGDWLGELVQTTKSGRELFIESRWTLVRDEEGRPTSILVINTDITKKKQLEVEFLRAQRMESIGTLAGGMAHDLNNVLHPISLAVELLAPQLTDPNSQVLVELMRTSSERAISLVKQVLSFARGMNSERATISLRALISEVVSIVQQTFPKNINLNRPAFCGDLWPLLGDATQLSQLLLNLCVNARDAMPTGGVLTLGIENMEIDAPFAAAHSDATPGRYVVLTVSDTGSGIPVSLREKIFDPFFTTKEQGKGTGLGLSTVMGIVRSHRGFVTLASTEGKETTFRVFLPASDPAVAEIAATSIQAAAQAGQGPGHLILIVDDEQPILNVLRLTLEGFGYRVLTARNGNDGLSVYAEHKHDIDAVITDLAMPGMDGATMIGALRELDTGVKIIATSGRAAEKCVQTLDRLGIQQIISKPYSSVILRQALRQILGPGASKHESRPEED